MATVGENVIKVPTFGFRLELDELGDLNLESCGKLKESIEIIEDKEGGRTRIADHSPGGFKAENLPCVRVSDLNDRRIFDWWRRVRAGNQEKKNGTYFWVKAGIDVAKMEIKGMLPADHSWAEGDANERAKHQKEEFTLKPIEFGDVTLL
jgi:hypothetical protein